MKPTINKTDTEHEQKKKAVTRFGIEAEGQKARAFLSGDLIEKFCKHCGDLVMAPSDAEIVTCGSCVAKIMHNYTLQLAEEEQARKEAKKKGKTAS